jgi:hypothetical protein
MIRALGPENVVAIVQGRLVGNAIAEAGLVVQPKKPKLEQVEQPAVAARDS